jgi:hypothetical protein
MTNLEKYDKAFIRLFKVKKEDLPKMKYMGDKKWDSMAHMDLMSDLGYKSHPDQGLYLHLK